MSSTLSSATFIIPDAPGYSLDFSIDCMCFETGPKFGGIGGIPQGLHFLSLAVAGGVGSRQGFFVNITESYQLVVRGWDAAAEDLHASCTLSEAQLESLRRSLSAGELQDNLGTYPVDQAHVWKSISNLLTLSVLERAGCAVEASLLPGDDCSTEADLAEDLSYKASSLALKAAEKKLDSLLSAQPGRMGTVARFCDIKMVELQLLEELSKAQNTASPATSTPYTQISRMMMDKSATLEACITSYYDGSWLSLLGELQLSFLLFLSLYSYPALRHWKALLALICTSENFLQTQTDFSVAFISALYAQLKFCPTDFMESEVSRDNFLRPILGNLFAAFRDSTYSSGDGGQKSLREAQRRFLAFVRRKFDLFCEGYGEEDCALSAEDLPVVVDSTELQAAEYRILSRSGGGSVFEYSPNTVSAQDTEHSDGYAVVDLLLPSGLSQTALENELYCWRYPLLFDHMRGVAAAASTLCTEQMSVRGGEDLTMTAARVLDECDSGNCGHNQQLYIEAVRFLEDESPKRAALHHSR